MKRIIALGLALVLTLAVVSCSEKTENSSEEFPSSSLAKESGEHSQPAGAAETVQSGPSGSVEEVVPSSGETSLPEDAENSEDDKETITAQPAPVAFISDQRVWESVWQEADWDQDAVKIIKSASEWAALEFPEEMPTEFSEESFYVSNMAVILAKVGRLTGNTVPFGITDIRSEANSLIAEVTVSAETDTSYPLRGYGYLYVIIPLSTQDTEPVTDYRVDMKVTIGGREPMDYWADKYGWNESDIDYRIAGEESRLLWDTQLSSFPESDRVIESVEELREFEKKYESYLKGVEGWESFSAGLDEAFFRENVLCISEGYSGKGNSEIYPLTMIIKSGKATLWANDNLGMYPPAAAVLYFVFITKIPRAAGELQFYYRSIHTCGFVPR